MGCGNDTNLKITIPVITISKSGGEELKKSMEGGAKGEFPSCISVKMLLTKSWAIYVNLNLIILSYMLV